MCDSHLQAPPSHLQDFHSHLQVLPSGSKLYVLTLFSRFLCDLEDLRALIEPSLRLGFYNNYRVLWSSKSDRNLQNSV